MYNSQIYLQFTLNFISNTKGISIFYQLFYMFPLFLFTVHTFLFSSFLLNLHTIDFSIFSNISHLLSLPYGIFIIISCTEFLIYTLSFLVRFFLIHTRRIMLFIHVAWTTSKPYGILNDEQLNCSKIKVRVTWSKPTRDVDYTKCDKYSLLVGPREYNFFIF